MPTTTFDAATGQCRVVFRLPPEAGASQAWLAGDFNDWSTDALPLEPQDDGSLAVEIELEPGRSYRFRYYLGGSRWDNDWEADAYVENEFGGADSVVYTPEVPDGGVVAAGTAAAPVEPVAVGRAPVEAVAVEVPPRARRTSKRSRRVEAGEVVA